MKERIRIQINLVGRKYPIKVFPEQEEYVRKAAKLIERKMNEIEKKYDLTDIQDIQALLLIELASELFFENEKNNNNMQLLDEKLEKLLKL